MKLFHFFLLAALLGVFAHDGSAQGTPDCSQTLTFTGAGVGVAVNTTTGAQAGCAGWRLTWSVAGSITAAKVHLEGSQDNSTFADFSGLTIVLEGVNPTSWTSATVSNTIVVRASLPYIRVEISDVSGTGTVKTTLLGYHGTSAQLDNGTGGGGGGSVSVLNFVFDIAGGTCTTFLAGTSCTASTTTGQGSTPGISVLHNFGNTVVWPQLNDSSRIPIGATNPVSAVSALTGWQTDAGGNTTIITVPMAFIGTGGLSIGGSGLQGATGATGAMGPPGTNGINGTNGQSVTAAVENPGANCTAGGWKFTSISGTSYVCNGVNGSGSGTVTSVTAGSLMTGGTITVTGTLNVDATKIPQKFFGTAAPGDIVGNLPGDLYTDTTAHHEYVCGAVAGTSADACTSVMAGGWQQIDGSSGGGTVTSITASAPLTGGTITASGTIGLPLANGSTAVSSFEVLPFGVATTCSANTIPASNQIVMRPWVPPFNMTVNQIRAYITVVNPSGGGNAWAVYSAAGSLIAQSSVDTTTATTTTKVYTFSGHPVLLAGTQYFLSWGADNNTVATCTTSAGDASSYASGLSTTILGKTIYEMTAATCSCGTGASFAFPATFAGFTATTSTANFNGAWGFRIN